MLDVWFLMGRRDVLIPRLRDLADIRAAIAARAASGLSFPGEADRVKLLDEEADVLRAELVGADRQLAAWGIEVRQ